MKYIWNFHVCELHKSIINVILVSEDVCGYISATDYCCYDATSLQLTRDGSSPCGFFIEDINFFSDFQLSLLFFSRLLLFGIIAIFSSNLALLLCLYMKIITLLFSKKNIIFEYQLASLIIYIYFFFLKDLMIFVIACNLFI